MELEACVFKVTVTFGTGRCCGSWTMPRTVPKTVARAAPANGKNKSTNHKTLRMRTLLLKWMNRAAAKPRRGLISKRDGRRRRVRRPRKRSEEEEREVRWNEGNSQASPVR